MNTYENYVLIKQTQDNVRITCKKEVCLCKHCCWELIIKHAHYINFGAWDTYTYVILAIEIRGSCI